GHRLFPLYQLKYAFCVGNLSRSSRASPSHKCTKEEGTVVRREAEHAHVAKKSYSKPQCISRSPSELVHLLRENLSAQVQSRNVTPPTIEGLTPILLVQGYGGDSRSIEDAARSQNLRGRSCDAAR